jgi:MFS family permease
VAIIAAKLGQGAGGALVLPAALAVLRGAYEDASERTRIFGVWAAWTGAASAAGPLLAGLFVDAMSWRAAFLPSVAVGLLSFMLLKRELPAAGGERCGRVPGIATAALVVALGAFAYLLMQGPRSGLKDALLVVPAALAVAGGVTLIRDPRRQVLFPRELLSARNCLPANAASFGLYFGMFGLSFLLVLYVQQVLNYSALWAAVVLLPISIMLLFAERFGRLTSAVGTRWLVMGGALSAAAGIAWIGSAPHPVPFWSHIIVGTALFGLAISAAVSALTHAAVAAVPEEFAGAASGLNHAVVRAAGLMSVALLGSIAAPGASDVISAEGFQRAVLLCAAIVAAGGLAGSVRLRDEDAGGVAAR